MMRATWLLGLAGFAGLACSHECALDDDLRLFAGDTALDCGSADEAHGRAEVDACVVGAFQDGTAFIARYQQQGEDSQLVTALAMNSSGTVKVLRWDSSPCGGGSCSPVTDAQSCDGPALATQSSEDPNALPISCASLGLAQRTCG